MAKKTKVKKQAKELKDFRVNFKQGKYSMHTPCSADNETIEQIKVEGFDKNGVSLGKTYYGPREYLLRFDIDHIEYNKRFFKED